jgi:hypothetical protein
MSSKKSCCVQKRFAGNHALYQSGNGAPAMGSFFGSEWIWPLRPVVAGLHAPAWLRGLE